MYTSSRIETWRVSKIHNCGRCVLFALIFQRTLRIEVCFFFSKNLCFITNLGTQKYLKRINLAPLKVI